MKPQTPALHTREARRMDAETAKIQAETAKLNAERRKIIVDTLLAPFALGVAVTVGLSGVILVMLKQIGIA